MSDAVVIPWFHRVTPKAMRASLRPLRRRLRLATRHARVLPDFLIIGAQRAGTSSLFWSLQRHPDVVRPILHKKDGVEGVKEIHFFDHRYARGLDWYRSLFPLATRRSLARLRGGDLVTGEATPYYLFHPAVPARVAADVPDVRLIALLRDPVERAYSHWQLNRRNGREDFSFEDALAAEEKRLAGKEQWLLDDAGRLSHQHRNTSYVARGRYADQLERWLEHFPRQQLLVLRTEDFLAQPEAVHAQVLAFLGLRPFKPTALTVANRASYAPIDPSLRTHLEELFAEPNARLATLLGRDFGWDSATAVSDAVSS